MATSPTQRTLAWLRKREIAAAITEHWNSFVKRRQDLFGFCDVVALNGRITAIQVTSGPNVAARIEKIFDLPAARAWLESGGLIEVHGWRKAGAKGKRKLWALRRVAITIDGLGAMVAEEVEP